MISEMWLLQAVIVIIAVMPATVPSNGIKKLPINPIISTSHFAYEQYKSLAKATHTFPIRDLYAPYPVL